MKNSLILKLSAGFGLCLLLIAGVVGFNFFSLGKLDKLYQETQKRYNHHEMATEARYIGIEMYQIIADTVINRDLAQSARDWTACKKKSLDKLNSINLAVETPADRAHVREAEQAIDDIIRIYEQEMLPLVRTGAAVPGTLSDIDGRLDKRIADIGQSLQQVAQSLSNINHKAEREYNVVLKRTHVFGLVISLAGVLAVIVIIVLATRQIVGPLTEITDAARKIMKGNYLVGLKHTSTDEIGVLSDAFRDMSHQVEKRTLELQNSNNQLHNEIDERRQAEEEVGRLNALLEQRVMQRTEDLLKANQQCQLTMVAQQQTELDLRESEDRFRQIFEQSEDAIVLISPVSDSILDINPVAEKLFGKRQEELINGGVCALCESSDMALLLGVVDKLRHGEPPDDLEHFDCRSADGEMRILSFRGKMITLQGENVLYTTFRDITRRVRLEEESREIQARLIHANRMTSLGTLVTSVAHEINNPNNYILMNADLLKLSWPDIHTVLRERFEREGDFRIGRITYSEAVQFLPEVYAGIADGARRINGIVTTLKNYGRDDRSGMDGLVDLNGVVRLSVSILNHHISRTTHHFSLDLCSDLPPVKGSVKQLEQVAINLITNALQALPDKDHGIRVFTGLESGGEYLFLRVEDEGGGIPPEIAARIMDPFFTTRLDRGGTGLGLAICANIVREHGGTIQFDSDPGKGAVFTVRLPRAQQVVDEITS